MVKIYANNEWHEMGGAAAISLAVLTEVTDPANFAGTAQLINADGSSGGTVDVVYDFDAPTSTVETNQ